MITTRGADFTDRLLVIHLSGFPECQRKSAMGAPVPSRMTIEVAEVSRVDHSIKAMSHPTDFTDVTGLGQRDPESSADFTDINQGPGHAIRVFPTDFTDGANISKQMLFNRLASAKSALPTKVKPRHDDRHG